MDHSNSFRAHFRSWHLKFGTTVPDREDNPCSPGHTTATGMALATALTMLLQTIPILTIGGQRHGENRTLLTFAPTRRRVFETLASSHPPPNTSTWQPPLRINRVPHPPADLLSVGPMHISTSIEQCPSGLPFLQSRIPLKPLPTKTMVYNHPVWDVSHILQLSKSQCAASDLLQAGNVTSAKNADSQGNYRALRGLRLCARS